MHPTMHEVSRESAVAARLHARSAQAHGQMIAQIAERLRRRDGDLAEAIAEHGHASLEFARTAELVAPDDGARPVEAFIASVAAHTLATSEHTEAVRKYLKAAQQHVVRCQ